MSNFPRIFFVILALFSIGFLSRWIPHPPNFTAVTAIALLSGFFAPSLLISLLLPVGVVALTDLLFFGFYQGVVINYMTLMLAALVPYLLQSRSTTVRAMSLLSGSLVFFFFSNLAVFMTSGMYSKTWEGFVLCYSMALPFYANQVAGELVYGGLIAASFYFLNARSWVWKSEALRSSH